MSEENVEIVRNWVAAINRGDTTELVELADPTVEYMPYLGSLLGSDPYRGHEGLRRYVDDLAEAWERYEVEIGELRDLGDDVLMIGRLKATGRSSGLEVEEEMAWLHSFRPGTERGRYKRLRFFPTPAEALEAAGLEE
ncbi:MAG: nuclear transport factor 2 family protein [Actinobacteria bacterium]|nr:nuclear transport factor 2 family protein [Actinomycetota bacterium]